MITEEEFYFSSGSMRLAGILGYPDTGQPQSIILLCGPHPNFAGNMDNNVIRGLFDDLAKHSLVLRFDYRGIGGSEIQLRDGVSKYDYWNEVEERKRYEEIVGDVRSALNALQLLSPKVPVHIVGYSFGAITGLLAGIELECVHTLIGISPPLLRYSFDFLQTCRKPCLLLSGRNDFVFTDDPSHGSFHWPPCVKQMILDGEDHFFRGREFIVVDQVLKFLNSGFTIGSIRSSP